MLRWRLRARHVLTVLALAVATTLSSAGSSAVASGAPRQLAAEVCQNMVRDAAIAAAGEELVSPQQGSWSGRTYTCTYGFVGGKLDLRVEMRKTPTDARARFASLRRSAPVARTLYGIGEKGFVRRNGVLVTLKDEFILTVDSRSLRDGMRRDAITWSTTRAIFDCW